MVQDFVGWRTHLEFVASLYNIHLRRAQLKAVHMVVVKKSLLTGQDIEALEQLSAQYLLAEALKTGDCDSLKQLLQRKGLDEKVRRAARLMDVAFRTVRGSDSEKQSLRKRFVAMRVWN